MNSASVFKNQSLITEQERVRIPDMELEEKTQNNELICSEEQISNDSYYEDQALEATEETAQVEDTLDDADSCENEASELSEEFIQEPEPELELPPPEPLFPSREELQGIYEQQLAELCASAAEQAYYDALARKKADIRNCIGQVKELMDELAASQRQFIEEYTDELKYMAIEIAEKMILEKIGENDMILQRLVMQSVKNVKNAEWLNLEISERLLNLVDVMKTELDKPEYNGKAHVIPIVGTDDVCRVTTEDGTIVSSISVQAKNLRDVFDDLRSQ